MTDFFSLPIILRGILSLLIMMLYLYDIFLFLQVLRISAGVKNTIISSATMFGSFILFQAVIPKKPLPQIDVRLILIPMMILICTSVIEQIQVKRIKKGRISNISVKEGLDLLPAGICFYNTDGLPMLTNHRMNQICLKLTGSSLSDAQTFWNDLTGSSFPESIRGGEDPIICLNDNTSYGFKRYKSELNGDEVYELIASDITEEYSKTKELEEMNRRISKINSRLKALNSTIRYMIKEKETLQLKTRLHDNLGQALILGRQFAHSPDKIDRDELIRLWKNNLLLLKNEEREIWQVPYYVNTKRAELLGVKIVTDGELPQDNELIPVIDTAIAVHTTNVSRHAGGEHAYIKVEKLPDSYRIHFTNDGIAPEEEIEEHGGLVNLHAQVRMLGGTMNIISTPAFDMELVLPRRAD
jgi:hypothetical protein